MAARTLITAVAILAAFQGCSAASASDTLAQAFSGATAPMPPPQHSAYYFHVSNATATKLQLQAIIQAYLADMGSTVDMMPSRSLMGLYQKESNYFKFLEYYMLHPDQLTPTTYDSVLPLLGDLYRQLVTLVKDGASVTSKGAPKFMSRLHQREYSTWSPEDSYVNLPDVVSTGISELRSWVNDFLDAGLAAANREVAAIMKQKREEELIPYVRSAQLSAQRASEWNEDKFQQFSSPHVYQDFVAARQELLDLELEA